MRYKCIIWDWNGTLLDDAHICIAVMNRSLAERRLPMLTRERYQEVFCFPIVRYYEKLGYDFTKEPFEKISTNYIDQYQRESLSASLREGCTEILDKAGRAGISQVILSASQIDNLKQQVEHFGVVNYFEKLLGLDHCHATSKIGLGKEWLKESGFENSEVLLVGDTLHDHETSLELGCDCLLVYSGHQSKKRLSAAGVPILNTLSEFERHIE